MYVIEMQTADLASATSSEDVVTLPADWGAKLVAAQVFVDTANCTGGGAALTCALQTGADGAESGWLSVSGHATNDQQELTFTLTKSAAGQNIAGSTRIRALTTVAGAGTAAATGVRYRLFFARPIMPA